MIGAFTIKMGVIILGPYHQSGQSVRFRSPLASVWPYFAVAGDTFPAAVLSIIPTACWGGGPHEEVSARPG